jgi:hypothetical protein
MRLIVCFFGLTALLFACKKPVSDLEISPTLDVEEKNMGVMILRTATWCGPCGASLNNSQTTFEENKDFAVGMAFKDAFSGQFGAHSDWGNHLFQRIAAQFDLPSGVPNSFQNFEFNSIFEHLQAPTIINGNYEVDFQGDELTINTTTKFFTQFEGDVYLSPFIVVDSLVGYQNGHPDGVNTIHNRYVADVAIPVNKTIDAKFEWGYMVSAGVVKEGHQVNMTFKTSKKPHWEQKNISVALIYFRKAGNGLFFINAFTK